MRGQLVLTAALALVACNDSFVEPDLTSNRALVGAPKRFITGVTWTKSSTDVDMIALGQFAGNDTYPLDVNDAGQVVGHYYVSTPDGQRARAFIWENGVYTDLGTLGGTISFAHQISNSGVIVGWSTVSSGQRRPVTWTNGVISELPPPTGESPNVGGARAINSDGHIAGYYGDKAVKWTSTGIQVLGILPSSQTSAAHGINTGGVVFGSAFNTARHLAWRWANGSFTELSLPPGGEISSMMMESARVFNDAGQFIGTVTDQNWNTRAFVYRDGQAHILPHPSANTPEGYAVALGINDAGDIAGLDLASNWTWRAIVWPREDAPIDLGIAPGALMSRATGINNGVFAVGTSYDSEGKASGALWRWLVDRTTPVVVGNVQGTMGANGWYVSDVAVTWTLNDPESGIRSTSGCDPSTISVDSPNMTLTCSATNSADLTSSATVSFKRDATPPSVVYQGNAGSYTVDQTIAITCSAGDAMSGLVSDNCQPISGDALTFGVGTHTFSATATDHAGLVTITETSFNITVTLASLAVLTRRYSTSEGVGEALAKLALLAEYLRSHGNTLAAELALRAYTNSVQAQIGQAFSAAHGEILIALARTFIDTRSSRQKPRSAGNRSRR